MTIELVDIESAYVKHRPNNILLFHYDLD